MKKCDIENCDRDQVAKGYCDKHYRRNKYYGDPLFTKRKGSWRGQECFVEGCTSKIEGHGYCRKHYQRWKKYGDPLKTEVEQNFHGWAGTRIYWVWAEMIGRCHRPSHKRYIHYGCRGISVCDRWRQDFRNFIYDMGLPSNGKSIDRVDNDGDYEPKNCRWATQSEQVLNKRNLSPSNTGQKNIYWNISKEKYEVILVREKKRKYLGSFKTLESAIEARNEEIGDEEQIRP